MVLVSGLRPVRTPTTAQGRRCKWMTSPHWAKEYHNPARHTIALQVDVATRYQSAHDQPLCDQKAARALRAAARAKAERLDRMGPAAMSLGVVLPQLKRVGSYWDVDVPSVYQESIPGRPDMGSFRRTTRVFDTERRDLALMRNTYPTGNAARLGAYQHVLQPINTFATQTLGSRSRTGGAPSMHFGGCMPDQEPKAEYHYPHFLANDRTGRGARG